MDGAASSADDRPSDGVDPETTAPGGVEGVPAETDAATARAEGGKAEPAALGGIAAAAGRVRAGRRLIDPPTAYYFLGVVRARARRSLSASDADAPSRVRYRDVEALVRPCAFHLPPLDEAGLVAHQRAVETVMRRATVLPAPPGVIFRSRRTLLRFLEDQYLALDDGLAFVDGHWELRLHVTPTRLADAGPELDRLAVHAYAELRRLARAAVPFRREERRLLSAAFLVERGAWIAFIERAEDLGAAHPELVVDVTGPWPPYDFVRMSL
ncbi:MAG TPA: GvpL/GvpF family gas vesicle protein [Longimicrobiales bacterium]